MASPDLVLMHPPSVMDFRKRTQLYGPVSDLIPSTPVFEMYPIGFTTIASHLESRGYSVRMVNIASRMLASDRFSPERFVRSIDASVFGIDLHWMPHVQGALELARMVKKHHPNRPVVFGGFSSSYYHDELIRSFPQVDYVLRGDSTEVPFENLMAVIEKGSSAEDVPNLTWRREGRVMENPLSHVPDTLDDIVIDYGLLVRKVLKYRDLTGHLPYANWKSNPMTIAMGLRGCIHNCLTCGGSCDSFAKFFNRTAPAFRSPHLLAEDIERAENYIKGATLVVGDIRQAGKTYASKFLKELKERDVDNEVILELFSPADKSFAEEVGSSIPRFSVQLSPETHDEEARKTLGKPYTNAGMEKSVDFFIEAGCGRFDLFYMIGLPLQTRESVLGTVEYTRRLYERHKGSRLHPFISPLAPFLDPGGSAFENPQAHGYKLFASSLEEHAKLAVMPSWKYVLNYETVWMSRAAIAESTYASGLGLNSIKRDLGLIPQDVADAVEERINDASALMDGIDAIVAKKTTTSRELDNLRELASRLSESTVCDKEELDWSTNSIYASIPRMVGALLRGK
ncbi:MAG: TIGR04190 family B12-binding domain/radical SAM domain protein [Methanobacteriota archaeon]|nr:MAG: TIGR04190 family B12-binding domain/radical SAM domain protein [Euryarchaeota archaeon]